MQGAGNDYVYVDAREGKEKIVDPNELSIRISDRHFGVGSDGLVLIMDSEVADFRMRMFNADGSEAGMCGNASRCVGRYVYELGLTSKKSISLETKSGIKYLNIILEDDKFKGVSVDMDEPRLSSKEIPVLAEDSANVIIVAASGEFKAICVNMGNPHAVIFVDDVDNFPVEAIGREIEVHELFPEDTNVEFVQIVNPEEIKMRVWERGSGETLACGTGACATLVAANIAGLASRKAAIKLLGGDVLVEWKEENNRVYLTGCADWVFSGEYGE